VRESPSVRLLYSAGSTALVPYDTCTLEVAGSSLVTFVLEGRTPMEGRLPVFQGPYVYYRCVGKEGRDALSRSHANRVGPVASVGY
jgi:hypothetical protein